MREEADTYVTLITGQRIQRRWYLPDADAIRGVVLLLHGWGDHIARHRAAAQFFCDRGFVCGGFDWPGNGYSEGKYGHLSSVQAGVDLIDENLPWVRSLAPDAPNPLTGLYAHSTGAFFALRALGQGLTEFDFAWLSSPLIRPAAKQPAFKVFLAHLLGKCWPGLIFDSGVRETDCQMDPSLPYDGADDPHGHQLVSTGFGLDLIRQEPLMLARLPDIDPDMKLLITQGTADPVCPPELLEAVFLTLGPRNKTLARLPGARHEPLSDAAGRALILPAVEKWFSERLENQPMTESAG